MPVEPVITLRPLEPDDAEAVASWVLDPRFRAAAGWTSGLSIPEHVAFQLRLITEPPDDLVRLGVVHEDALVGYVVLQGSEPARRELGFVIGDSRHWGRGFGRRAAEAGLDYGFGDLKLTEIWAEALAANVASVRILQGLGMTETEPGEPGLYLGKPSRFRCFTIGGQAWQASRLMVVDGGGGRQWSGCRAGSRGGSRPGWWAR